MAKTMENLQNSLFFNPQMIALYCSMIKELITNTIFEQFIGISFLFNFTHTGTIDDIFFPTKIKWSYIQAELDNPENFRTTNVNWKELHAWKDPTCIITLQRSNLNQPIPAMKKHA